MYNNLLLKYAKLAVKKGVNIQKDQLLVINSPIDCSEFARMIADEAYKYGASDVVINYSDEKFNRIRFMNSTKEVLSFTPEFERDKYDYYVDKGAAFLSISAADPNILQGIEPEKISSAQKSRREALKKYHEACTGNKNSWCIVSIPTEGWATKVFSSIPSEEAVEKLWDAIFNVMRITEDNPVNAWDKHVKTLHEKVSKLNEFDFDYLHFTNSLGTDLKIELVNGVNGIVYSSKPLSYMGNLINNFSVTFKDGAAVDCNAETGLEILKELINSDENSKYLGEVALVPFDSPISNSNIIFYNTLYDENASCHLAFGSSYPSCIKNGENMSKEDLLKAKANSSITHVDFMIGTSDTNITGVKKDGTEIQIFRDGNWAI